MQTEYLYSDESYKIFGAIFEVHKQLGCGFFEKVYQEALAVEFNLRGIPFEREVPLSINYKGVPLSTSYVADFVCYGKIILELKSIDEISTSHKAQVINYLKLSGYRLGILANFGENVIKPIRILN